MMKPLPAPRTEILEMLDRLSPSVVENIKFQLIAYNIEAFSKLRGAPSEKKIREVMLCGQKQFDRLIREAAKEHEGTDHE